MLAKVIIYPVSLRNRHITIKEDPEGKNGKNEAISRKEPESCDQCGKGWAGSLLKWSI
jgi:hypothetical protein